MHRSHRVAGALVGSAVGDALGAPFEFGPAGQFSARFPAPARGVHTEMCGGGPANLEPGEFTTVTRTALRVATSLSEHGSVDETAPAGAPTTTAAIWFARFGSEATVDAARRITALNHGDPSAADGGALFLELMRVALDGGDPLEAVAAPNWTRDSADESKGTMWPTLGKALWALRNGRSFAEVMRLVIDLGGDTATVAAVAGGLAGAVYGIACIPMRWTSVVHGRGFDDRMWRLADLEELAPVLDGRVPVPHEIGVVSRPGSDGGSQST